MYVVGCSHTRLDWSSLWAFNQVGSKGAERELFSPVDVASHKKLTRLTAEYYKKEAKMKCRITICIVFVFTVLAPAYAQKPKDGTRYKEIIYKSGYDHDKWITLPQDRLFKFRAYTTSFDGEDDDNGDGIADRWGVPEWVAFEIRKKTIHVKADRPSPWLSEETLYAPNKNIAPKDSSYHFEKATTKDCPSLIHNLSRGHMCPKNIANRLGKDADYNTHTILNACPQKQWHNNGIWKDLERLTENWADEYEKIWVICGPVFHKKTPKLWLGEIEKNEKLVAVPDGFYKIIIRESGDPNKPEVIAFLYPHAIKPNKNRKESSKKGYPHKEFLVSIDKIEKHTGLDFFTSLTEIEQKSIEEDAAAELWADPGKYNLLD